MSVDDNSKDRSMTLHLMLEKYSTHVNNWQITNMDSEQIIQWINVFWYHLMHGQFAVNISNGVW